MGVPGLVPWLTTRFKGISRMSPPTIVDGLLIDINGIIHGVVHKDGVTTLTMSQMAMAVVQWIHDLIKSLGPRGYVYLAMDGVAPRAKMNQQRTRRYMSAVNRMKHPESNFDSNSISPGTELMEAVSVALQEAMVKWSEEFNFAVVLSDTSIPGEGEHKLLDFLREWYNTHWSRNQTHIIAGSDADLVLLGLTVPECDVHVMRDLRGGSKNKREFVSSRSLREALDVDLRTILKSFHGRIPFGDLHDVVSDFVVLCTFVGNDFMPRAPCGFISESALDNLVEAYATAAGSMSVGITQGTKLNFESLHMFLQEFAEVEMALVRRKASMTSELDAESTLLDEEVRKVYFSTTGLREEDSQDMAEKYLQGLEWVWKYYCQLDTPSWEWMYPYHYAPFMTDLVKYLDGIKPKYTSPLQKVPRGAPVSPMLQLLCILPPPSSELLPKVFQSSLEQMEKHFPVEWIVDATAADKEFQSVVRIPFLNYDELIKFATTLLPAFTESEVKRNTTSTAPYYALYGKRVNHIRFPMRAKRHIQDYVTSLLARYGPNNKKAEPHPHPLRYALRNWLFQPYYTARRKAYTVTKTIRSLPHQLVPASSFISLTSGAFVTSMILSRQCPLSEKLYDLVVAAHYATILNTVIVMFEPKRAPSESRRLPNTAAEAHIDWLCVECKTLNFQRNLQCWICGRPYTGAECPMVFIPTRVGGRKLLVDHSLELTTVTLKK